LVNFDSFEKVTEAEWRAKIDKDLKGKAVASDYKYNISEGIEVTPFTTDFESKYEINCHFPAQSKVGVRILLSSLNQNDELLNLLSLGAEVVAIEVDIKSDFSIILEGVFLDLIDLVLITQDDILVAKYKLGMYIQSSGQKPPKSITYTSKSKVDLLDNELFVDGDQSFSERLLHFHRKVINSIHHKNNDDLIVKLTLKPDFYAQIAELRVMRKIFHKEVSQHGSQIGIKILTFIDSASIDKVMHPMIGANYLLLSSKFGSADMSFGFSEDSGHDLIRLSLHAQNIYNLESNLNKVTDPWAGSYTLESMTEAMLDFIYEQK